MMDMEDASHLLEDGQMAEQGKSCVPVMGHSLPIRLLIPNQDERHVSPTSTNTSAPSALTTSRLLGLQRPAGLKYPLERCLPPSGPYYDQYTFAAVMHQTFSKNRKWCASCWMLRHGVQSSCLDECWICSTRQHVGRVGPRNISLMVTIGSTDLNADSSTTILRRQVVSKQKHI